MQSTDTIVFIIQSKTVLGKTIDVYTSEWLMSVNNVQDS